MKIFFQVIVICFLTIGALPSWAQKQLVLLKNERVILRLHPGDDIVYKLKNSNDKQASYINNLFDAEVVVHDETVPLHEIERLYFKQTKFYNVIGGALVTAGVGIFLIDQANEVIVQGNKPSLDKRVTNISLSSLAVGLPMLFIKKKSQRIRHPYRLLTVTKGSPFYQPEISSGSNFIP